MFRRISHHVNVLQLSFFSRGRNRIVYVHAANEALYNLHDLTTPLHLCSCIYICMCLCEIHTARLELRSCPALCAHPLVSPAHSWHFNSCLRDCAKDCCFFIKVYFLLPAFAELSFFIPPCFSSLQSCQHFSSFPTPRGAACGYL